MSLLISINFSIELAGVCNLINTWCGRGGRQLRGRGGCGVLRERLVECGPVLHAVTKLAKTHLREVHVVFPVVIYTAEL
jgi:hypothetical protein